MKFQHGLCIAIFVSCANPLYLPSLHLGQLQSIVQDSSQGEEKTLVEESIARTERQLPQLPDRGAGLYVLSTLNQQLGHTEKALQLLKECVSLREGFDPAGSPNLGALHGRKEFDELVAKVHKEFPVVNHTRIALIAPEVGLMPEGLAYDVRQDAFYLSSLNRRKIVRITRAGRASDFVPQGRYGLLPVLGIRPDPDTGTVWAASWSEDTNQSELLHFDGSGTLLGRFVPTETREHGFNDLVIGGRGDILLTDSLTNEIYRFDPISHAFQALTVCRPPSTPNGIAITPDRKKLYVADDFGVVLVDLQTGLSSDVHAGPHSTLAGIDGLYWWKGNLVAVQNAIGSPRIAMFRLSKDGKQVVQTTVLENRPSFRFVPTTGAIRGRNFYFIIDSQADKMDGDKVMKTTKLEATRIGILRLPRM